MLCPYADCQYAECDMSLTILPNVIMLSAIVLRIVAPISCVGEALFILKISQEITSLSEYETILGHVL